MRFAGNLLFGIGLAISIASIANLLVGVSMTMIGDDVVDHFLSSGDVSSWLLQYIAFLVIPALLVTLLGIWLRDQSKKRRSE